MALNFDVKSKIPSAVVLFSYRDYAHCNVLYPYQNRKPSTRNFEFDSMVRRENEKSVDSRFLKNVWVIRNLHTRGIINILFEAL
jgi:hypothetical protein